MPPSCRIHYVRHQIPRSTVPKPVLRMSQVHSPTASVVPLKQHMHPAHVAGLYPPFYRKATVGPHVQTRRGRYHNVPVAPVEVECLPHFPNAVADSAGHGPRIAPNNIITIALPGPPTHQSRRCTNTTAGTHGQCRIRTGRAA